MKQKNDRKKGILYRYKRLPHDLHSRKFSIRNRAQRLLAGTICIPLIAGSVVYMFHWFSIKNRIIHDNNEYTAMYNPTVTEISSTRVPEDILVTEHSTVSPTAKIIQSSQPAKLTVTITPTMNPTASPTPAPTTAPTISPTPEATAVIAEIANDELLIVNSTPNAETVIYAAQTPPPVQESFKTLLAANNETIGYLKVGSQISLPVVQRYNDNEYYLTHNLRGEESEGGTLFLDGSNLLVPEDPVLLIYGHNMKNGTMFQPLTCFERPDYLRANPIVRFDTLYKNKLYTPVAVFSESVNPDSDGYVNIRQFTFDETLWELYILKMEKLSIYDMDIDAQYGDHLLLLVTCEYMHDNGRLVVVLRELRSGESEDTIRQKLASVQLK